MTGRRWIALLTACVMLAAVPGALAAGTLSYTLDHKLIMQMETSGYSASGAVSVSGDGLPGPLDDLFQVLRALDGADIALNGSGSMEHDMDTRVTVTRAGTELLTLHVQNTAILDRNVKKDMRMNDGSRLAFSSSLTGTGEYGFTVINALTALENSGLADPALLLPIRLRGIAERFAARGQALSSALTDLMMWMSVYAEVESDPEHTVIRYTVPQRELRRELGNTLAAIRADREAEGTLAEVLGGEESLSLLTGALKDAGTEEPVFIRREYDASAVMLETRISVPLAPGSGFEKAELTVLPEESGDRMILSLTQEEEKLSVELLSANGGCSGSVERVKGTERSGFRFSAVFAASEVSYDRVKDLAEQSFSLSLAVCPLNEEDGGETDLSVTAELSCGQDRTAAVSMELALLLENAAAGSRAEVSAEFGLFSREENAKIDLSKVIWLDNSEGTGFAEALREGLRRLTGESEAD